MDHEGGETVARFPTRLLAGVVLLTIAAMLFFAWGTFDAFQHDLVNVDRILTNVGILLFITPILAGAWFAVFRSTKRWQLTLQSQRQTLADQADQLKSLNQSLDNKVAELEVKRREADLRTDMFSLVAERAKNGVVITDRNGRIEWANDALTQQSGYTLDELVGQTPRIFKSGQHGPAFYQKLWKTIQSGRVWQGEIRNRRKNGSIYFEDMSIIPLRAGDGSITKFVAFRYDLTERKESEARLRESAAFNKHIIDNSQDCIEVLHIDGRLEFMSPGGQALLEIPDLTPYIGSCWAELWKGDDRQAADTAINEAKEGRIAKFSTWRSTYRGTPKYWDIVICPIQDDGGRVVRLLATSRDITKRHNLSNELRLSQERLELATSGTSDGVWDWDIVTGETWQSPRCSELMGYRLEDPPGTLGSWKSRLHFEDRQHTLNALQAHLDRSEPYDVEYRLRMPDGNYRWLHARGAAARNKAGAAVRMAGSITDIDDRKRAEQLLKQRAVEAELLHRGEQIAAKSQEFGDTMQQIVDLICDIVGWPIGHVYLPAGDGANELVPSNIWHVDDADAWDEFRRVTERTRFAPGVGLPGRILQSRQAVWIQNFLKDPNFLRAQCCSTLGLKGAFGFPIVESGKVVAVFEFFHRDEKCPDEDLRAVMQKLGIQLGSVLEHKRTQDELAERAHVSSLAADVGLALAEAGTLREGLQRCTEFAVEHLDVAFARIWTLDPNEPVLCLQASAGMYTHIDGGHARVPVGKFKIGLIAAERKPHLTNQVVGDSRVGDQEWAKREGMVSFAGYPLLVGQELMGVMALFARRPLSDVVRKSLAVIGEHIALGVYRKQAKTELEVRLQQQEAVAALGQFTLNCKDPQAIMQQVAESVAGTLDVNLCKVLELLPDEDRLLLRAGVGWREGLVGQATVGSGCNSQAGYTLIARAPVIVENLKEETRFSGPPLLHEHGVVSGISVLIEGANGKPFGVLGAHSTHHRKFTGNDVNFMRAVAHVLAATFQRGRAEELLRQRESLRSSVKAHEQLLGVVGHELRTPLAGLRAMSEFLLDDSARQSAEFDGFLQGIHDEVIRMGQTVNDLLEVARLNSGLAQWTWAAVEVDAICDRALETVQTLVDATKVSLEKDVQPEAMTMSGDAGAIRRLLVNLLDNARKHTPTGSIRLSAREESDEHGRWIEFNIRDTGAGMSADVAAHLGQAFALNSGITGESHVKGSGLGLAICRGIVAAHGGKVTVESAHGKGTRVIVRVRADLKEPAAVDDAAQIVSKVTS